MEEPAERPWVIATVAAPRGIRFGIALGADVTADNDPVAYAYRSGHLAPVERLLSIAASVLRPGDRVLDLGAHLGGFALAAAAMGCHVIAVEASPRNAALLRRSAAHNRFDALEVVHAAVAEDAGTLEFASDGPWGRVATSASERRSEPVSAVRIDDLLAERGWRNVDFVKIDVEGSEIRAFRGMPRLLAGEFAPLVWFESNRHTLRFYDDTPEKLEAELRRFGYAIHRVHRNVLVPKSADETQAETVVDYLAAKRLPEPLRKWKRTVARRIWSRMNRLVRARLAESY